MLRALFSRKPIRIAQKLRHIMRCLHKHAGFHELLTYGIQLNDNTIFHKDGAFSKHFKMTVPDSHTFDDRQADFMAETWRDAITFLGNGWMVETHLINQPINHEPNSSTFSELVSSLMDEERKQRERVGYYVQSTLYLSLSYKPSQVAISRCKRFILDQKETHASDHFDGVLHQFNQDVEEFIQFISRACLSITSLNSDELTTFLHHCISGQSSELKSPAVGSFLDTYVTHDDFVAGMTPRMGAYHITVLSLDEMPPASYPDMLAVLSQFPYAYRWASRFVPLDSQTAYHYLKRHQKSWSSKAIGLLGVLQESMGSPAKIDGASQAAADSIQAIMSAVNVGQMQYGFYNCQLIFFHEDAEVSGKIRDEMATAIQQRGFRVRHETVNATEGYLGSLPGHGGYNLRKIPLSTQTLSHLLPTSLPYQGKPLSPCHLQGYLDAPALITATTQGNKPFYLNLHVGDVGHTAILGPTGSGKSTLIGALIAAHRQYERSRIIVLDKDYSNHMILKALGGAYYDLNRLDCTLSPLAHVTEDNTQAIDSAFDWLCDICILQGVTPTTAQKAELRDALHRLACDAPSYKNLNHLTLNDETLRQALHAFNQGQVNALLNGTETEPFKHRVMGFEMGELLNDEGSRQAQCLPIIQAIFNILDRLFQTREPTLLILEEAWAYLKHPLFQKKLTDWFKTLRKANVAVLFISQDLADIAQSHAAPVIQNSCMTRIYLPNAAAHEPAVESLYRDFGLNDAQIDVLYRATPKQDYYLQQPQGCQLFRLDLGPLAKAFLCVSDKTKRDIFERLQTDFPDAWLVPWLKANGLHDWVALLEPSLQKRSAS